MSSSIMQRKLKNENYLTNFQSQSYIKEEIILPDITEDSDDEALSTASLNLRADEVKLERFYKIENNLTLTEQDHTNYEIDDNVNEKNEKLFVEAHKSKFFLENIGPNNFDNILRIDECNIKKEEDVILNGESQLFDAFDHPDESIMANRKECKKFKKQTALFNFLKITSPESSTLYPVKNGTPKAAVDKDASRSTPRTVDNKDGKVNVAILICLKCTRKEKFRSTKTNCQDCKELMTYECLKCGDQISTISALYYHINNTCRQQQRTYQCEQPINHGKKKCVLRSRATKNSAELKCPRCGKNFKQKSKMLRHKEGCGINIPYLKCKFCPVDTKYQYYMMKHMENVHSVKPQQLDSLMKTIVKEGEKIKANALNTAIDTDVNTTPRRTYYKKLIQLYCIKCDGIRENVDYIKERDCPKCGEVTLVQCVKCSKRYPKMSSMYKHLKLKCVVQHIYQCADCDFTSTRKRTLAFHIGRRHPVIVPKDYERCSKCGRRYKCRLDRIYHERRCGSKPKLQDHILHPSIDNAVTPASADAARIKEMKKLIKAFCPKCEKNIKYEKHGKRECGKCDTTLTYPCSKCGMVYTRFYDLRIHVTRNHLSAELKKR